MESIWGTPLLEWFARHTHSTVWVAGWRGVAFLGSATFFVVLLPLALATLRARTGLHFTAAVLVSGVVTEVLKAAIARPRLDPASFGAGSLEAVGEFGVNAFPSGHVLMAVVVWGWVAAQRPFRGAGWVAGALITLIAASRMALLRHDLLDISAGLGVGALVLVAVRAVERRASEDLWQLPWVEQAGLWTISCGLVQWSVGMASTAVLTGVLAGAGVGTSLLAAKRAGSEVGLTRRWVRGILALGGVLVARQLASGPMPEWGLFGVYAAAGLWVALVVPGFLGGAIRS